MSRVALADVLWDAANLHLSANGHDDRDKRIDYFSCCALEYALERDIERDSVVDAFLRDLGCVVNAGGFEEFRFGRRRQGVRYIWLLLAACVAEDEGIVIERGAA